MQKFKPIIDPVFAKLLPPLSEEEYSHLEKSLVADGVMCPLVVWREEKILVDGHHRYEICQAHKLTPVFTHKSFASRGEVATWMISTQLGRRNLNTMQKGLVALEAEEVVKEEARDRKLSKLKQNKKDDTVPEILPEREKGDTRDKLAKAVGISGKTLDKVKVIRDTAPADIYEKALTGEISVSKAATIAKQEARREESQKRNIEIEQIEPVKIKDLYDVVVIDPPWPMKKIKRDCRPNQVDFDYPTMTEKELCNLYLPMNENCHVWLWTTQKFLPMAFSLLDSWKLKYICTFVWHKPGGFQPVGLPQYNCEFALYARYGTPKFIDTKNFNLCFNAQRGKHSEKPMDFYEMVRRVTNGKRIDMFARKQTNGFDGWGKEYGI